MASQSMRETYAQLKKGGWMNRTDIAFHTSVSPRAAAVAAHKLVKEGLAKFKTVDRTQHFKILAHDDKHPLVADIKLSLKIKGDKK